MGINGGLPMLGRDDDQRRLQKVLIGQFFHHLPNTRVDKFDFVQHRGSRGSGVVEITTLDAILD